MGPVGTAQRGCEVVSHEIARADGTEADQCPTHDANRDEAKQTDGDEDAHGVAIDAQSFHDTPISYPHPRGRCPEQCRHDQSINIDHAGSCGEEREIGGRLRVRGREVLGDGGGQGRGGVQDENEGRERPEGACSERPPGIMRSP